MAVNITVVIPVDREKRTSSQHIMIQMLRNIYRRFRHLFLYGVIGAFSAGLDFALFNFLVRIAGVQYILANSTSVVAGIVTSFILNRNYNFRVKDNTHRRFALFLTIGLCGMLLSNLILYLCVDIIKIDSIAAKVLSIVVVALLQFLANKFITFKPEKNE